VILLPVNAAAQLLSSDWQNLLEETSMVLDSIFNVISAVFRLIGLPLIVLMAVAALLGQPLRISRIVSTIGAMIKATVLVLWRIAASLSELLLGRLIRDRSLRRLAQLALQTVIFLLIVAMILYLIRP